MRPNILLQILLESMAVAIFEFKILSRVEGKMSRVESKMSRVEGKMSRFDFLLKITKLVYLLK